MTLRLGNCKISINFYFFALLTVSSLIDDSGMLSSGIFAAALHELGHIAAMRVLCGSLPEEIRLSALGLRMKCPPTPSGWRWAAVASAGAAANCAGALIAAALPGCGLSFAGANIALAAINMLPVEPLDGGEILRTALYSRLSPDTAESVSLAVSAAVLIPLAALGVWILLDSPGNFSLLILSLWLLAGVAARYI